MDIIEWGVRGVYSRDILGVFVLLLGAGGKGVVSDTRREAGRTRWEI